MFRVVHKHSAKILKPFLLLLAGLFGTVSSALADGPPQESSMANPAVLMLVIIMFILLLVIGLLANVLLGSAEYFAEKEKSETKSSSAPVAVITGILVLMSVSAFAQDPAAAVAEAPVQYIKGLSQTAFYSIIGVIAVQVIVILFMLAQLRSLLARKRTAVSENPVAEIREIKQRKGLKELWSSMNFRPIEEEADLELHHDYDGIRELNNRLPPWWLYGFYITIIFAGIYLWRYHVAYSAPSSTEEFQIAMQQADIEKAAYLKKSANNVDENTVKLSTEPATIEAGKKIFITSCAACHGPEGQGTVGPNLTDEYWLHGGSVSSIFKSIKYGWPEKGMKSWKDDFSPVQISQLSSFIKSIAGTKPANGKEPQGTIDTEPVNPVDSTAKAVAVNEK
jgi:cytochrome c oxidase cbb3-type subunit III